MMQCKLLKKAYRKERRRAVLGWQLLWFFAFLLLVYTAAAYACLVLVESGIPTVVLQLLLAKHLEGFTHLLPWVCLGVFLLWVLAWSLWIRGARRVRKGTAYLEWRTMKLALEAEKEER